MKSIILVLLCVLTLSQDVPEIEQDEMQIFNTPPQSGGIIFIEGGGEDDIQAEFMLNSFLNSILASMEDMENHQDQKFLDTDDTPSTDMDSIGGSPFSIFGSLLDMLPFGGESEFVEVETITMNGQTQRRVTKTVTRNGVKEVTTEITTSGVGIPQQQEHQQLSPDFQIYENTPIHVEVAMNQDDNILEEQPILIAKEPVLIPPSVEQTINLDEQQSIIEPKLELNEFVKEQVDTPIQSTQQMSPFWIGSGIVGMIIVGLAGYHCNQKAKNSDKHNE